MKEMTYNRLGKTELSVSSISFGASALGGMFRKTSDQQSIETVEKALELGINYIDVSPAYGATKAETVLGKGLAGIDRSTYYLSTKVGKTMFEDPNRKSAFDFSRDAILSSLDDSHKRLGVDFLDIVHLHDIEYENGSLIEHALHEGLETLSELKATGQIGAISVGTYPIELSRRILSDYPVDALLIHNHYQLNDTLLTKQIPLAAEKDIGLINASPFAMGLLTDREPPAWHPANAEERNAFKSAADLCQQSGTSLSKLAFQFATQNPHIPTTLFSTSRPKALEQNLSWHCEPHDPQLVRQIQEVLSPVLNKDWDFANTVG